jgi:hypothetical protein
MTTAIQDRLDISVSDAESWMNIPVQSGGQLTKLELIISGSKQISDEYCNNPFEDADGVELDIPDAVKIGVLQVITDTWNSSGTASTLLGKIKKQKADDLEEEYAQESIADTLKVTSISVMAQHYLIQYRLIPGGA